MGGLKATIFAMLALGAGPAAAQDACDAGFKAFQTSVYAKVQKDCALCHAGNTGAPPFATADVQASYARLLNYVQWGDIPNSLLAVRAGNGHCGRDNCNAASGADMLQQLQAWWDGGEKSCPRAGNFFTAEVQLPADLPHRDRGFLTLALDLGVIRAGLAGVHLAVDIQDFATPELDGYGAYQLRNPRLVNGTGALQVKNLKVLLDGTYDPTTSAYTTIDRVAAFWPAEDGNGQHTRTLALSSESLLVLKTKNAQPKIQVAFDVVANVAPATGGCLALGDFARRVWIPAVSAKCDSCHDGSSAATPSDARVFDLQYPDAVACAKALEMADQTPLAQATLVGFPLRSGVGHPRLDDALQVAFYDGIKAWLKKEGRLVE